MAAPAQAFTVAASRGLAVYATAPGGLGRTPVEFGRNLSTVAAWAEAAGVSGLLVFTDNDSMDPWAAAQFLVERTTTLVPMVAVQPTYMHPYTAARTVSTIATLHGRRIDLNLVTGSYRPHLEALGSWLDHDERYDRLLAYGQVVAALLRGAAPLTYRSRDYQLVEAAVYPPLPDGLSPRVFVAGSSPAAVRVARTLEAVRLTYPKHPDEHDLDPEALQGAGIRIGVIARPTSAQAWRVAHHRYPADPDSERFHARIAPAIEAHWHRSRWRASQRGSAEADVYWLHPFRVSREFCPYLVGSYVEVGAVLARYLRLGISTLILSVPQEEDDLYHAAESLRYADPGWSAPS